jgi:small subunit ribosomal protein S4
MHGRKGKKKVSNYGEQLAEKQKVKFLYGILEKQMRKLYDKATKTPASTGKVLLSLLERRLDNAVYRLGLAPTRAAARQMVVHGNVRVNNAKLNIPSYSVQINDVVTLTDTGMKIPAVAELWIKQKQFQHGLSDRMQLEKWLVCQSAKKSMQVLMSN